MNQCSFMRIKPYLIIVIIISPFVCRVILIKTLLNSMQAKVINSAIQKLVFMRIVCYDRTRSVNVNCLLIAIRTYPDRYQVVGTHGRHFSMYHWLSFFRHAFVRYLRLEIPTNSMLDFQLAELYVEILFIPIYYYSSKNEMWKAYRS